MPRYSIPSGTYTYVCKGTNLASILIESRSHDSWRVTNLTGANKLSARNCQTPKTDAKLDRFVRVKNVHLFTKIL